MSLRKLAKEAFDAAKDRYRQYEEQKHGNSPQYPGHHYHSSNKPYFAPAPSNVYGYDHAYPSQASQATSSQAPNYLPHQAPAPYVNMATKPTCEVQQHIPPTAPPTSGQSPQPYYAQTMRPGPQVQSYGANQEHTNESSSHLAPQVSPGDAYHDATQKHSFEASTDIFEPLNSGPIPIPACDGHPVPSDLIWSYGSKKEPLQTNAFYNNWLLGGQNCSIWTHPYSLSWSKGQGNARSWGIAVNHVDPEQLAFGPAKANGGSQYYINPVGIQSVILSAKEVGEDSSLTIDSPRAFSAKANLSSSADNALVMTLPLVQGMGFVTALYRGCTPLIESSVFFRDLQPAGILDNGSTAKQRIILEDGKTWLLYVSLPAGNGSAVPLFKWINNTTIEGPSGFQGIVQVAKLPPGNSEDYYDRSAGSFASSCTISARSHGNQGTYTLAWSKGGLPKPLLMYALDHHVSSFTRTTATHVTPMRLRTTTKGMATAVLSDVWQMKEQLPVDMGFSPWLPTKELPIHLSPLAAAAVVEAGRSEIDQDVVGQCNLDSMYFSGKGLGKFAMMAIALHEMAGEQNLAKRVLDKLKQAFAIFVENRQRTPLVYEKSWKGVVSKCGMNNAGADFGNGYYNDHHFHYGYYVYAAAVIGHLDPEWLGQGKNKAWVDMLVRDFANPVNDSEFPFFRSFDWYHGHSWAKGLFESGDGKDEESTSEDAFASYALKMWGKTCGDANLEARGNLMLAIQARVFQTYFLLESSNTTQPRQILPNKVTGITFENKVDHATYFGMNSEYIQGIHMIPLAPPSSLVRTANFVKEEWATYFSDGRADQVGGGWRGILYANLALAHPKTAFEFFVRKDFDCAWLDGGASRTWYLAWCAALGGV
ncbi:uncharacterized protein PV09_08914 [Verruconis gallopava]|uniref:glucan endo-1,3-beta-D-glucosidase n=1 Tax=Verruconis gallopava TaxID=253628 RepID=A0A0D1ZZ69_9PEZI|nr:uncharacterized protein PV09_08914 [Verruconis gallopava]KIV99369.1 hypothetical protein PV09_08914 [Verruconis gallopava]